MLPPFQVVFSTIDFVSGNLGPQFVESPPVALSTLYEDMANTVPLVFVLSPGSDPMSSFLRFAKEMGYSERSVQMTCIYLGSEVSLIFISKCQWIWYLVLVDLGPEGTLFSEC